MSRPAPRLARGACALVFIACTAMAACDGRRSFVAEAQDRERVVLRASNIAGVPLHPSERSRQSSGRLPDGAEVEVVRWSADRRWLEVRAVDGTLGWIVSRYISTDASADRRPPDAWSSPEACLAVLRDRPARDASRVRIASWNLRWFPDGSSHGPSASPTDVDWVACLLATMRIDALAVQEIMLHERGLAAIDRLLRRLGELAGGRWVARFDGCPRDGRQHVGWIVDTARARLLDARQLDALNPVGGCSHHLRPGHAVHLRFGRGLDLSAIVVHLDSGQSARDHGHRQESYRALSGALRELRGAHGDDDVLVLGDFNTMGCRECAGGVDDEAEIAAFDAAIGPALRRVPPRVACTALYRGRGSLLDHVLASASMRELSARAAAEVHGPCAQHRCELPRGVRPPMLDRISDHCPLVIELDGADLD